ncbi:hypothetical protein ACFQ0Q_01235 [Streptomyces aureus]
MALALTGFAVPPLLVLSSVLAESMVPRAALTQAFTWLNSASAADPPVQRRSPGRRWTRRARTAASQ